MENTANDQNEKEGSEPEEAEGRWEGGNIRAFLPFRFSPTFST